MPSLSLKLALGASIGGIYTSPVTSAPTWTPYGSYTAGQYVWYSGNIYQCSLATSSVVPTNPSNWLIIGSGSVIFDSISTTWFNAVSAAGSSISAQNQISINTFLVSMNNAGVWSSIQQANLLVGPTSIAGALVPLAGTVTNNNFVAADYNYLTGLMGNAGNKYLITGYANNSNASKHMYVCATSMPTKTTAMFFMGSGNTSGDGRIEMPTGVGSGISMGLSCTTTNYTNTLSATNGFGMNHNSSTTTIPYINGNLTTITGTAPTQTTANYGVFCGNTAGASDARIAFYSLGASASIPIIDTCVKTLLTALV